MLIDLTILAATTHFKKEKDIYNLNSTNPQIAKTSRGG